MQRSSKLALLLLFVLPLAISGQNYVNNPYTRFGVGDLMNTGFAYNKALGGSSVALRPANQINYLNPASYTSQDTMSFLFQAGLSGRLTTLSSDMESTESDNMNLDYFVMGFPITRRCNFSLGLVPFNRSQYYIRKQLPEIGDMIVDHQGEGGYNEFYFGTAVEITPYASVGVNASYLFGSMTRDRLIDDPDATVAGTWVNEEFTASDFHYRVGAQLYPEITSKNSKSHRFILAASYEIKSDIGMKYSSLTSRKFPSNSNTSKENIFNEISDSAISINLPAKLGIGFSYIYDNRLLLSTEYSKQNFSEGLGLISLTDLSDYSSVRFGAEFTPVPMTARKRADYWQRIRFRAGAHYTNTYLNFYGQDVIDKGISVGLGFPWRNAQKLFTYTAFNISYEYGVRGTTKNNLIQENYHVISVGVTLHDFWFMKPKYD